jgi:uncharacterized delta-60 repeat protein
MKRSLQGRRRPLTAFVLITALLTVSLPGAIMAASPGSLDPSFGTAGRVTTNLVNLDTTTDVAVQPDGKIIVSGRVDNTAPGADFGLTRYNANGTLDTTFSGDGKVTTDFGGQSDTPVAIAIQHDGKIVAVGSSQAAGSPSIVAAARYLPNGTLDTTFDGDGRFTLDLPGGVADSLQAVAIQADGKIVGSGGTTNGDLIVRLNLNGSLDTTFDTDGIVTTDLGGTNDLLHNVAIQADGKIIVSGTAGSSPNTAFMIGRYLTTGAPDLTFDTDGFAVTDIGPGNDFARGLTIQPDGKYVLGGTATIAGATDIALVRYTTSGSLDTTFDGDGRVTTDFGGGETGEDVVMQSDGKLVVAARSANNFAAVRYNLNGSIDTGFGNNGKVLTEMGPGNERTNECLLYGDKLLIVGDALGNADFAIARYNLLPTPTGSADFDGDGVSDYSIFRPSTGTWFVLNSSSNNVTTLVFGQNGDIPVDADLDGDGRSDIAVWRPATGTWFFQRSSDGTFAGAPWGALGDKPVPGDYDKDGKTDLAIWRPSDGINYIIRSSTNSFFGVQWGGAGDIPVMGASQ